MLSTKNTHFKYKNTGKSKEADIGKLIKRRLE